MVEKIWICIHDDFAQNHKKNTFHKTSRLFAKIMRFIKHAGCGWSGGTMVLGKLPVPGRPAYLVI